MHSARCRCAATSAAKASATCQCGSAASVPPGRLCLRRRRRHRRIARADGLSRSDQARQSGARHAAHDFCSYLQREAEGLDRVPYPGELGKRIFEQISKPAWQEWLKHQTMLMNEYRLSPIEPKARKFLAEEMEKFLFGTDRKNPGVSSTPTPRTRERTRPSRRRQSAAGGSSPIGQSLTRVELLERGSRLHPGHVVRDPRPVRRRSRHVA